MRFAVNIPIRKRRWLQYSLRTVFLLTTLLAVWLGLWVDSARRQARAIDAIRAVGGRIDIDAIGPQWLSDWFDGRYCVRVTSVSLDCPQATDANLEHLKDMPHLMLLSLGGTAQSGLTIRGNEVVEGASPLTDKGLKHLEGLSELASVRLWGCTNVTDEGVKHLQGLENLTWLRLGYSPISDAGIDSICHMSHLEKLDLTGTRVTAAGTAKLRRALPNLEIVRE